MPKKPSVYVNEEVARMFARMAKVAAQNAIRLTGDGDYIGATEAAAFAKECASEAGGNAMRQVSLI